ncbi:MAG: FkbM family methyltransferase [Candidatus Pelagibacter sp.]
MKNLFEYVANVSIKFNLKLSYKFFYKLFKFFLKDKIILKFPQCKFFAYPQKKDLSRWMIRNLKIWDEKIINLIIKQINDSNSIFIDIGCNYGAYSIPISRIKNNLKVICFDPSRKSLDRLDENINLNNLKNIKYYKLGIGEKKGKVYFDDDINNYKNSGSFEINNQNLGYKINIDSIDNLVRENKIQIKKNVYIKMDIEGYEFFALKGLVKTIKNYNVTIFFEFSKKILENHLNFESEFVEFLNKNTLKIYNSNFVEQNPTDLILDLNNLKKDHDVLDNFILQKKDN